MINVFAYIFEVRIGDLRNNNKKIQKIIKKWLTLKILFDIMFLALMKTTSEANIDKLWRGIEVVITRRSWKPFAFTGTWVRIPSSPLNMRVFNNIWISQFGEVPKRLKGLPWKGSRSLIAARGFKSLLLRLYFAGDQIEPWKLNSINQPWKISKILFFRTKPNSKKGRIS